LVQEVGRQAALLSKALAVAESPPLDAVVACATRVQLLLEDGVVLAQRLVHKQREQATLAELVG
jgi:hypothetical protein